MMDPKLHAILTIFIIGLVAFLIGLLLSYFSWKRKYRLKETAYEDLKTEHLESQRALKANTDRNMTLERELESLKRSIYQKDQLQLSLENENHRLKKDLLTAEQNSQGIDPNLKQKFEQIETEYSKEVKLRRALEIERDRLKYQLILSKDEALAIQKNPAIKVQSIESPSLNIRTRLKSLYERVGFGSAIDKDDLTQISGIGPDIQEKLNEIGVFNFKQIASLNREDLTTIDEALQYFPGRAERDNWIGQAQEIIIS